MMEDQKKSKVWNVESEDIYVDMRPEDVKPKFREPDPNTGDIEMAAAQHFFSDVGLPLVPDAIEQLVEAFLPALKIICERGYHPEGNTWKEAGWRGILTDIKKKSNRLWYRSWIKGGFDKDSARDLINFAGFYIRLQNKGEEWGSWGPPSSEHPPEPRKPGKPKI